MKKIFITGITGLLGTNLANELLRQGYIITAILRDPGKYTGHQSNNLRLVKMDLWGHYIDYLKDIDIVIHVAAETSVSLPGYKAYDLTNYKATVRLFEMSLQQQIKQFIFISSANTIGYGNLHHPGNETMQMKKPFADLFYAQSKIKAEKYLQSQSDKMKVIILNPGFMLGAYDSKPSSGKIILMGLNKKVVFYPPGGKNFVPVKDVVSAILNSFKYGISGKRYLICGENISYKVFFQQLKTNTGQSQSLIPLPKVILYTLGYTGNLLRLMGFKTNLSSANMKVLCTQNYYSSNLSQEELKIKYTSVNEAIQETVDYFNTKKGRR
ncbi:NAD-dependent epimerase/dehydratase family protein [Gynurincola endophyticus]|jgi:dihydroflavonol-4-reductase|uniref:NAD-dependent epimerase/dehydratase family protein n=1 Tax=Gynurincola endophyticus TaxID=2479004 RepID=UPI000F8C85C3|nr:NAD-dependent epimerase/dehydratase family protein [Gynurincola endophyticus]